MLFFNKIYKIYKKIFFSIEKQARLAGVHVGENCFFAEKFWSSEGYLISIGNQCAIAEGVRIHTHGGASVARDKYPDFDCFGKVTLGNFVYVGSGSHIMPGVTIGDNVLIASCSVVTKSIPSGIVVAGNPAKFVCTIEEYIERNSKYNTHSKGLSYEKKRKYLLSLPDYMFIKKDYVKLPEYK